MAFTVTFGWWLIPLLITIVLTVYYGYLESDPWGIGIWMIVIPGSLISWLVWALLKAYNVIGF